MNQFLNDSLVIEKNNKINAQNPLLINEELITNKTDILVLQALRKIQPATRTDLCKTTGIPRTTIYDALARLMLKKIVRKYSIQENTKGRPKIFYKTIEQYLH